MRGSCTVKKSNCDRKYVIIDISYCCFLILCSKLHSDDKNGKGAVACAHAIYYTKNPQETKAFLEQALVAEVLHCELQYIIMVGNSEIFLKIISCRGRGSILSRYC